MKTLWLLILSTGLSVLQQVMSGSIMVPKTVTAVEGSCVVVPCQTQPYVWVTWYQYNKFYYPKVYDRHLPSVEEKYRRRTSAPGTAAKGNCTLLIKNIRKDDNNLKVYVWITYDSTTTQKFHDTVTISVVRQSPVIFIQEQIADGDIFWANCSIIHSCPSSPPSFKWTRSHLLENSTVTAVNQKVDLLWMYTEILQGRAIHELHSSTISCSAVFSEFTLDGQQVTLNILYKPVTVTVTLRNEIVIGGENIVLECSAHSNPPPHTYSWFTRQMGQNMVINTTDGKLLFENFTQKTSFSCFACNNIGGKQSDWLDLDIPYAPKIRPESFCHLRGEFLKCVCQAEAFPHASIHWSMDGNDSLPSSLSFVYRSYEHVVSGELSGHAQSPTNITCTATNFLGKQTEQIHLNNLPVLSLFSTSLVALAVVAIAVLFGCAVVICRKYCRHRSTPGSVCNTVILLRPLENSPGSQANNSPSRVQVEATQSSSCREESDPEADRLSCVYDNDGLEDVRRACAQQNHDTAQQPE